VPIIINGGSNCAGGWWAKHLENGDKNDRIELIELAGLTADTVPDAFREMQGLAAGTRCKNFFYQANINPREDEHLTPEQWREAVDQLEKNLGLAGQPRFVIEHEKKGRTHRHVIWSRIDVENARAIPDSLTAVIHERTSRELEKKFGLEPGKSILLPDREDDRPDRGPRKWEKASAERGGFDPKTAKAFITRLWQTTDTGKALKAALESHGWMLARGDKATSKGRAYVMAIDPQGGMHELARRVDGVKAAAVHARVADIDPASLPSVEQAKTQQHARLVERENRQAHDIAAARAMHEAQQAAKGRRDDTRADFAAAGSRTNEPEAPMFDRDAADRAWAEKVAAAAIARDEAARGEARGAGQGTTDGARPEPEDMRPLSQTAADIRTAWSLTNTASELEDALAARGITLACVTPEEARDSERVAAFAKEVGNFARVLQEGEIVAVNARGDVHRLDQRTTGDLRPEIEGRLAGIDRDALLSVTDAKEAMREAARAAWTDERRAEQDIARPQSGIEARIAEALADTMTGTEFAAALDKAGLTITRTTETDQIAIAALRQDAALEAVIARAEGTTNTARHFDAVQAGDFAAVTRAGDVFRLNPAALDFEEITQRLSDVEPRLPSVVEARAINEITREQSDEVWAERRAESRLAYALRSENRDAEADISRTDANVKDAVHEATDTIDQTVDLGEKAGSRILGGLAKALEGLFGALDSFMFGQPAPSRDQAERADQAAQEKQEARADQAAHHERAAAQDDVVAAQDRQQQQDSATEDFYRRFHGLTRDANERDRERDDFDRGRERER
jgi:hypothetical protein